MAWTKITRTLGGGTTYTCGCGAVSDTECVCAKDPVPATVWELPTVAECEADLAKKIAHVAWAKDAWGFGPHYDICRYLQDVRIAEYVLADAKYLASRR